MMHSQIADPSSLVSYRFAIVFSYRIAYSVRHVQLHHIVLYVRSVKQPIDREEDLITRSSVRCAA
jgi:hypothetical protein